MRQKLILVLLLIGASSACTTKENSTRHDPEGANSTQGPQNTVGNAGSAENPVSIPTPEAAKGSPAPIVTVSPSPGH